MMALNILPHRIVELLKVGCEFIACGLCCTALDVRFHDGLRGLAEEIGVTGFGQQGRQW